MTAGALRLALVAGEHSGDRLAAGLLAALRARCGPVAARGIGGPALAAAGCAVDHPMEDITLMGFDELPARLAGILRLRRRLAARLVADPPDVFVGVDVPDFNLGLEARLRRRGVPVVHYVSPTVWAWRRYRLRRIGRAVDHMLVLFPFEAEFYARHGVPVTCVGHPMADDIEGEPDARAARRALGLDPARPVVALLPGSRLGEVRRLGEVFLDTAVWLAARHPGVQFALACVDEGVRAWCQGLLAARDDGLPLTLVTGAAREVMAAAEVVLLASGTAALEAALLRRPMVVAYRMSWPSYLLVRAFAHVRLFSMPNHLTPRPLVPEFIQSAARPGLLGPAVARYLEDPAAVAEVKAAFAQVHGTLRRGASARAAEVVCRLAGRG